MAEIKVTAAEEELKEIVINGEQGENYQFLQNGCS